MKATEFVKKHGWGETQRIIQDYPSYTHFTSDARMFINENSCMEEIKGQLVGLVEISDLKRRVDSYKLVESYGGLELAKLTVNYPFYLDKPDSGTCYRLSKAIADVEACQ